MGPTQVPVAPAHGPSARVGPVGRQDNEGSIPVVNTGACRGVGGLDGQQQRRTRPLTRRLTTNPFLPPPRSRRMITSWQRPEQRHEPNKQLPREVQYITLLRQDMLGGLGAQAMTEHQGFQTTIQWLRDKQRWYHPAEVTILPVHMADGLHKRRRPATTPGDTCPLRAPLQADQPPAATTAASPTRPDACLGPASAKTPTAHATSKRVAPGTIANR